jgi:hypothetical protein
VKLRNNLKFLHAGLSTRSLYEMTEAELVSSTSADGYQASSKVYIEKTDDCAKAASSLILLVVTSFSSKSGESDVSEDAKAAVD